MRFGHAVLGSLIAALAVCSLAAQTPVLGSIEAPYAALQSSAHVAGTAYGPGAVTYGPAGTPLVLTGSDLGASGTVEFIPYVNGSPGTPVSATATSWDQTMIFVTVPSGAATGLVKVSAEGKQSNGLPFIVMPGTYAGTCPAFPSNSQLQITTASLSDGTAGQAYSASLSASGGAQSYTWSITSGTLPNGLSLNSSTGTISGTPTSATGPMDLTVQVTDSSHPTQSDEAILSLTIESQTLTPAPIYTYSASYDGVGNVTGYSDSTDNGTGSIMGTWAFQYDALNRLVTGTSGATTGPYANMNLCWSYDSFGNRTAQSVQTSACPSSGLTATASYNANNQVTWTTVNSAVSGFQYDASGDVTNDNVNTYLYDAEGRICAVESAPVNGLSTMTGYLYDGEGRRVAKGTITTMSCDPDSNGFQLTESYVLGQGGEELTQLDGSGNWQRTNAYGSGKQLATYDVNGLHFQITDPLGTRRMQTNDNGQPETDIQSLPYGDQLSSTPDQYAPATADNATPLHFTGKERDTESGLDYFINRYYGSSMGRFTSPDPSGLFYSDPSNPQSLNLYAYVQNNPLVNFDPDGLDCFTTSNLTSSSVTVTTYVGATSCDGIAGGTYVNGTINTSSYSAQVGSDGDVHVGFGYASNDASTSSNTLSVNVGSTDIGPAVQGDGSMFSMSQNDRIQALAQGITADTQHSVGCIAGAYGVGGGSAVSGGAGTNLWNSSQNLVGKARFGGALGGSTAYTSEAAMAARASSWGSVPFRVPTPVGTPFTGNFAMRSSSTLGGAAGRYAPYAGAAGKALGVAGTAYSSYKLWNCLGGG